ncbi:hypothetical protein ASE61_19730 [Bosea sp. Root670]|nr:hypothetical protein ASE61_19730 [Bosea sp. Root670]
MAPLQLAQAANPVSKIGPVTTRGAVTFGLRARRLACTRSNSIRSTIAGTSIWTCSLSGFWRNVLELRRLNTASPI